MNTTQITAAHPFATGKKVEWFRTSHETGEKVWEAGYKIGLWGITDGKVSIVATRSPIIGSTFTVPITQLRPER